MGIGYVDGLPCGGHDLSDHIGFAARHTGVRTARDNYNKYVI